MFSFFKVCKSVLALILFSFILNTNVSTKKLESWKLDSPNKQHQLIIKQDNQGGFQYKVLTQSDNNQLVVAVNWSKLGLKKYTYEFTTKKPAENFGLGLNVVKLNFSKIDEKYSLLTGKKKDNHAVANGLSILAETASHAKITFEFRAYNEGVAIRYHFPEQSPMHHFIEKETTEFNMSEAVTHFGQPYDQVQGWNPAYETFWAAQPAGTPASSDYTGWGFPSLFENKNKTWVLIHEAGLYKQYHGMHLEPAPINKIYRVTPPLKEEASGIGSIIASHPLPWTLPWRVIMLSNDLSGIVENNLVSHLNKPSIISQTDWIKPGIASWSWLSDWDSSKDMVKLKQSIDFGAEMKWDYTLIDANWNLIHENSLQELTQYAKAKNIGLFFWYNSGGKTNFVSEEPRNIMNDRKRRRAEFSKLQTMGVKGVKIDFFQSDKQFMLARYIDILEDAADFHILVNFHGCTIPRGWERTYPHLMTMESVKGAEAYTFGNFSDSAAKHNTLLPYARNVVGSMDYTPTLFADENDVTKLKEPRATSYAHEAALAVAFESGVQHLADHPTVYRKMSPDYNSYLSDFPTAWDETVFLQGYPGKDFVVARRAGKRWYIVGMNGENKKKSIQLDLNKLNLQNRKALLLFDSQNKMSFNSKTIKIPKDNRVSVDMAGFGGFVIKLLN